MTSRAAPEFWQRYHKLSPEIQAATRKAYQLLVKTLPIPVCDWNGCDQIRALGRFG